MATLEVVSSTADGALYGASSVSYSTARSTVTGAFTADELDQIGQYTDGAGYFEVWQTFYAFDTSALTADAIITSAVLSLYAQGGATVDTLECRLLNWGPTLTTADWTAGADLSGLTLLGSYNTAGGWGNSGYHDFSDVAMSANVNKVGTTYVMVHGAKQRTGVAPSADETSSAAMADNATAAARPVLTITYTLAPKPLPIVSSLSAVHRASSW